MKKMRFQFLILQLLICVALFAQDAASSFTNAFNKGNATELSSVLENKVDLIILANTTSVAKQEAIQQLNAFFADHKVASFKIMHQGQRTESGFIIGILTTNKGNFRVNTLFKKEGDKVLINQIRVEKNNE